MSFCKIVYLVTILFIMNFSIIVWSSNSAETECNCLYVTECEYALKVIRYYKDKSSLQLCALPNEDYYCCPSPRQPTISERKCTEFSKLKDLCNETGLVADGKPVDPHSIPFIASLQTRNKTNRKPTKSWEWICGGALIDTKFILTAAHCVDGFNKTIKEMSVLLGAHNKTEINNSNRFNVKIITKHPNYNHSLNDIAILEMERPADFSTFKIRPACLPTSSREDITEFRAAGFGRTNEGKESSELLQTTLMTHDITKCNFTSHTELNETLHFCAGPNGKTGKDVCSGDSGGPTFGSDPNHTNCLFSVMGIITKGNNCEGEGARTLHTRVSYYRKWIEQIVWPNHINKE